MTEPLALGVMPGTGWSACDIQTAASEAEDAGFDAVFTTEVNNDAMATAQLLGVATRRITMGTWVANTYPRHPYVCARGAALITDATEGRFILGLGVSHQPVNRALAINMPQPLTALRHCVTEVRGWLQGAGPATYLAQRPSAYPVPIYVATLTSPTVELVGELADGIMPFLWPTARVGRDQTWAALGRALAPTLGPLTVALDLPTLLGHDLAALRDAARQNLGLFTTFPFFQRLLRASGFREEAARMEQRAGPRRPQRPPAGCRLPARARCREQLTAFRAAGVDLPILLPPVGVEPARAVIRTFRR
jgi:5,10-methylenetetrahydromethanopterin reductase